MAFSDKINSALCLSLFYKCFFLSIAFYLLTYAFKPKRVRNLIENDQTVSLQSYFGKSLERFLQGTLSGFIHAMFVANQIQLFISLISIKILLLILNIFNRRYTKSQLFFWCTFFYIFFGIFYDLFFLLTYCFNNQQTKIGQFLHYFSRSIDFFIISEMLNHNFFIIDKSIKFSHIQESQINRYNLYYLKNRFRNVQNSYWINKPGLLVRI